MKLKNFIINRIYYLLPLFVFLAVSLFFSVYALLKVDSPKQVRAGGIGIFIFAGLVAAVFFSISVPLQSYLEKKITDKSWTHHWLRSELATKHRKLLPIAQIEEDGVGKFDFRLTDKNNLLRNRTYLKEKINDLESSKREFIRQFEDLGVRREYKKISANYSMILTEFDDATTVISKTLAEIEQKIRGLGGQEVSEKRGTPEFSESKEKYIPPTQPNWD